MELAPGTIIDSGTLPIIAGPCVIESEERTIEVARRVAEMAGRLAAPFLFKASFDKANRSALRSFRGPGLEEGLRVLAMAKAETGLEVLTDVHEPDQCERAAEVCAVLQIPAFLCRNLKHGAHFGLSGGLAGVIMQLVCLPLAFVIALTVSVIAFLVLLSIFDFSMASISSSCHLLSRDFVLYTYRCHITQLVVSLCSLGVASYC